MLEWRVHVALRVTGAVTPVSAKSYPPSLSVVIVIYNMEREARRSLYALSAAYQRDVTPDDYEVVVVDNGSAPPFNGGSAPICKADRSSMATVRRPTFCT